jgi:hypothetical protein
MRKNEKNFYLSKKLLFSSKVEYKRTNCLSTSEGTGFGPLGELAFATTMIAPISPAETANIRLISVNCRVFLPSPDGKVSVSE